MGAQLNTPLDSLKTTAIVVQELLEGATDRIAGSLCDHDHDDDLDVISLASQRLWEAVAEHVPRMTYETEPFRMLTFSNRYDDGSPITEQIVLDGGAVAQYMPRVHGDREAFLHRMNDYFHPRPHGLRLVED